MDDPAILILCTAPAEGETAATLARGLVDARLAACVNLVPGLRSFYRWEGAVQDDPEVQLLIKTRLSRFNDVEAWLCEHHPYEVPEVLAFRVERGAAPYLSWLAEQSRPD